MKYWILRILIITSAFALITGIALLTDAQLCHLLLRIGCGVAIGLGTSKSLSFVNTAKRRDDWFKEIYEDNL